MSLDERDARSVHVYVSDKYKRATLRTSPSVAYERINIIGIQRSGAVIQPIAQPACQDDGRTHVVWQLRISVRQPVQVKHQSMVEHMSCGFTEHKPYGCRTHIKFLH